MRELTIILLAIVVAIVVASKETEGTKDPSSRSSSEEGTVKRKTIYTTSRLTYEAFSEKAVEASGEETLKKIEVADQNLESSGAVDKTSVVEDHPDSEGSGEASRF
ncbi:hypothetical protein ANCCAN_23414 [Ancylostoma caninum]|uniref:Secreted protein n=1 Tax=Ancylostoma caninum TaxID=29170 RepID=A0A368FJ37_ANCCA|nr:hypothetical protein ANCCAN_23414 [Ancylostoma caninum]